MSELIHWAISLLPADLVARYQVLAGLWDNPQLRAALILLGFTLLAALIPVGSGRNAKNASLLRQPEREIKRVRNTSVWRRLWWKIRPPRDIMRVDGLAVDRTRRPHCLWLGPTGAGKSASVATVRVDGARPTLIVTPDLSDPFIDAQLRLERAGVRVFRWTACVGPDPVDFLIGEPTEVAERLTEVFRSGGTGAWKREVRMRVAQIVRAIDDAGKPRSLQLIGELLREQAREEKTFAQVAAGWIARFLDLADQFGPSIGLYPGCVDLAALLRQGATILLDNDAFEHPALTEDVVALGLAEARRCASLVPGGFRLIFEEAGQLGERIDLAHPFLRAGRRRSIAVDVLTQAESDLDEAITSNAASRFYFAQELKSLRKVAADRLGLDETEIDVSNMRDFTAWFAHGRIRRLVRFPRPAKIKRLRVAATDTHADERADTATERSRRVQALEGVPERLMLPAPSAMSAKLAAGAEWRGGCLRWKGKHDKKGYGLVWIDKAMCEERMKAGLHVPESVRRGDDGGYWDYVHLVRYEEAYGPIPREWVVGKNGRPSYVRIGTVDHTCRVNDCLEISDLEYLPGEGGRGENVRRMLRRKGAKVKA